MDKAVVLNNLDFQIAEITPGMCKKLLERGFAIEYTAMVMAKRFEGIHTILTKAGSEREFRKIKRLLAKEIKEENKNKVIKVTCWKCGKQMEVKAVNKRSYCEECANEDKIQNEKEMEQYLRYRAKFMLNKAMKMLENQKCEIDMRKYRASYELLKEVIEKDYRKFDSSHEVAATMELLRNRLHVKVHPSIAKHKPDFMLRELKVILEIDGFLHKTSLEGDFQFDINMRKELGCDWEVIRIPTEYIESNIMKLVDAIVEMKKYKQKIRKENNGLLPQWFSARDKKVWKELKI